MMYDLAQLKTGLKKVEEKLAKEFSQVHTGRASPAFLDSVLVETYGAHQPIKNVGSISIEDPKTLRITPWDKAQIKGIEKAIATANLGLSVATDAEGLRVIFPQLTTETRMNMVKILKEKLEEARIGVRKERDRVWGDVQEKEKEKKLTEDDKFRAKDEIQKLVDEANKNLEAFFDKKEKEIMS